MDSIDSIDKIVMQNQEGGFFGMFESSPSQDMESEEVYKQKYLKYKKKYLDLQEQLNLVKK